MFFKRSFLFLSADDSDGVQRPRSRSVQCSPYMSPPPSAGLDYDLERRASASDQHQDRALSRYRVTPPTPPLLLTFLHFTSLFPFTPPLILTYSPINSFLSNSVCAPSSSLPVSLSLFHFVPPSFLRLLGLSVCCSLLFVGLEQL